MDHAPIPTLFFLKWYPVFLIVLASVEMYKWMH